MQTTLEITQEELLDALREAAGEQDVDENGITRYELQVKLGWSRDKTGNYLRQLIAEGKCKPVWVTRYTAHGKKRRTEGYTLTDETELARL